MYVWQLNKLNFREEKEDFFLFLNQNVKMWLLYPKNIKLKFKYFTLAPVQSGNKLINYFDNINKLKFKYYTMQPPQQSCVQFASPLPIYAPWFFPHKIKTFFAPLKLESIKKWKNEIYESFVFGVELLLVPLFYLQNHGFSIIHFDMMKYIHILTHTHTIHIHATFKEINLWNTLKVKCQLKLGIVTHILYKGPK